MTTYRDICCQVEELTPDEQWQLLEALAAIVRRRMTETPKRSILGLEGLGKDIWHGIEAQAYVDQERASWER
ncbi:hypothetical protein XM38_045020 [Halomicronema hongdechloris C2206]|uniref:DUF2281 domain-containing protein n=1 Tax=Halomicronema hongdechloris C2206 TaxID=1641165 RepID=A0A1Z3HTC7_9CYAN|nr:hypothetical protein [Halomicronema hongdechloris]ASC73535.1 hypothetical protein XM38_045020 [Halomicronema hongdechloris C2206]